MAHSADTATSHKQLRYNTWSRAGGQRRYRQQSTVLPKPEVTAACMGRGPAVGGGGRARWRGSGRGQRSLRQQHEPRASHSARGEGRREGGREEGSGKRDQVIASVHCLLFYWRQSCKGHCHKDVHSGSNRRSPALVLPTIQWYLDHA